MDMTTDFVRSIRQYFAADGENSWMRFRTFSTRPLTALFHCDRRGADP